MTNVYFLYFVTLEPSLTECVSNSNQPSNFGDLFPAFRADHRLSTQFTFKSSADYPLKLSIIFSKLANSGLAIRQ